MNDKYVKQLADAIADYFEREIGVNYPGATVVPSRDHHLLRAIPIADFVIEYIKEHPQVVNPWRPMSDESKSGQALLFYCPNEHDAHITIAKWNGRDVFTNGLWDLVHQPTHFMPLRNPPEHTEQASDASSNANMNQHVNQPDAVGYGVPTDKE